MQDNDHFIILSFYCFEIWFMYICIETFSLNLELVTPNPVPHSLISSGMYMCMYIIATHHVYVKALLQVLYMI